jgi:hypothetical protein
MSGYPCPDINLKNAKSFRVAFIPRTVRTHRLISHLFYALLVHRSAQLLIARTEQPYAEADPSMDHRSIGLTRHWLR